PIGQVGRNQGPRATQRIRLEFDQEGIRITATVAEVETEEDLAVGQPEIAGHGPRTGGRARVVQGALAALVRSDVLVDQRVAGAQIRGDIVPLEVTLCVVALTTSQRTRHLDLAGRGRGT